MRPVDRRPASRWRTMCGRGVALAAVLSALLSGPVIAADDDDLVAGDPAIPPGEETLIATMLGRGTLVHDCKLMSGGVEYAVIKATYNCPRGEVTLELGHLQNATATSTQIGQFALTVQSGSPPPGFQEALASRIQSRETYFAWSWPEYHAAVDDAGDDGAE